MPTHQWVFDPNSGGKKIPSTTQGVMDEKRIQKVAEEQFKGHYTRLDIRFRGQFCYVDAYTEPKTSENWPPADWPETREEYLERMRSSPHSSMPFALFWRRSLGFCLFYIQ